MQSGKLDVGALAYNDIDHKLYLQFGYKHNVSDLLQETWPMGQHDAFSIKKGSSARKGFQVPKKYQSWVSAGALIPLDKPDAGPIIWTSIQAKRTVENMPVNLLQDEIAEELYLTIDELPLYGTPTGGETKTIITMTVKCYHHFGMKNIVNN